MRVPSCSSTSASKTFSSNRPENCAGMPHELFPNIPPMLQRLCVEGAGPTVSWYFSAACRTSSSTTPGSTTAILFCGSSLDDAVHVLAVVEDDRRVATRAGQTRSTAARCDGRAVLVANRHRLLRVVRVFRQHDRDWVSAGSWPHRSSTSRDSRPRSALRRARVREGRARGRCMIELQILCVRRIGPLRRFRPLARRRRAGRIR